MTILGKPQVLAIEFPSCKDYQHQKKGVGKVDVSIFKSQPFFNLNGSHRKPTSYTFVISRFFTPNICVVPYCVDCIFDPLFLHSCMLQISCPFTEILSPDEQDQPLLLSILRYLDERSHLINFNSHTSQQSLLLQVSY